MSGHVVIPPVRTFAGVRCDKAQALKVLKEASEVFGAWQALDREETPRRREVARRALLGELADTIQAACNLAQALGVDDLHAEMAACEARNAERGRY